MPHILPQLFYVTNYDWLSLTIIWTYHFFFAIRNLPHRIIDTTHGTKSIHYFHAQDFSEEYVQVI